MKRKHLSFLIFSLILVFGLSFTAKSEASVTTRTTRVIVVPEDKVVDKDFYITAGESIEINGSVLGDVVVAGGRVDVNGNVTGDVIALGGTIIITGSVDQNVRAIGGNIEINGEVGRNVSVAGEKITLTKDAKIGGGIILAGGDVSVYSEVPGDTAILSESVVIANKMQGNADIFTGNLKLTDDAVILGDLIYISDNDAFVSDSASISGRILRKTTPAFGISKEELRKRVSKLGLGLKIISFIATFLTGAALLKFLPNLSQKINDTIQNYPLKSFIQGILTVTVATVVLIFLLMTIIGIPLALLILTLLFVLIYSGKLYFSYWLGSRIVQTFNEGNKYLSLLIGMLLCYAVILIQPIGIFAVLLILLISVGAEIQVLTAIYKELLKSKAI